MKTPTLLLRAAAAFAVLMLLLGCGQRIHENLNKEYVLGVSKADPATIEEFRKLVSEFNDLAGVAALRFTEDFTTADSLISLTKDLQATDGKVGWGQWITQTKDSSTFSGTKIKTARDVDYAMSLEFDEDYVLGRRDAPAGSVEHYELQKLFFHEVGHGLQMPHHPDRSNVMYYEISGPKDFDLYFRDVATFFGFSLNLM